MSAKEIKTALKEAREAIKSKDFKVAVKKCQEVLKWDKENYMALVLLGAAHQDSNKEEAAKFLRKAVTISTDHLLALQGLVLCAGADELPEIYAELLTLQPERCTEFHNKLNALAPNLTDTTKLVQLLLKETSLESSDINKERIAAAWKSLAQILMDHPQAETDFVDQFEQALLITAKDVQIPRHSDRYRRLIPILNKKQKYAELLDIAEYMSDMYLKDTFCLEWICKVHSEVPEVAERFLVREISYYIDRLMELKPKSPIGLMSQGVKYYRDGDIITARDILLQTYEIEPNWTTCQLMLYNIYVLVRAFTSAEFIHSQIKGKSADLTLVKCLVQQKDAKKAEQAIEICKQLLLNASEVDQQMEILTWFAKALLTSKQLSAVEKVIQKLESINADSNLITLLKALALENDLKKASESLKDIQLQDSDLLLDVGEIFLNSSQPQIALIHFLTAAKLAPYNSEAFYYLGKTYSTCNDDIRATKCLEKCVKLNSQNEKAVYMLSSIYRKNENWDSNVSLLQDTVKHSHGSDNKWGYFQLGLHYLARHCFDEAVSAFRTALRYESNDGVLYEGLADAYFARGSYKSALKVYEKAIELLPKDKNQYARLQVANVKKVLQNFTEAIVCYQDLLQECPKYVPALKGIAETHYQLAWHLNAILRQGRAQLNAQEAVFYLEKAIDLEPSFACFWRLFAAVLELVAELPSVYKFLDVPGTFVGTSSPYKKITGDELMELAGRCYSRAIKIRRDDHLVWYQLAANYFKRATAPNNVINPTQRSQFMNLAEESVKHAIKLSPQTWENWNLLGVISATDDSNLPLAQHCFIQSLNIDKKSAVAWTNLGLLYLKQGNIKLANKAFGKAQQSDTTFVYAWIGQSSIAEHIGETDEAMDLFRHCTELEFNMQSAIGYTNRVCAVLDESPRLDKIDPKHRYVIQNMHAITVSLDQINWYCKREASLEGLCLLGYFCVANKLYKAATVAYESAVKIAAGEQRDKLLCDLGYAYLRLEKPENAIKAFKQISEANLKATIGSALAYFRAQDYEESYSVYGSALEWLASSNLEKQSILIAMSSMVYAFQGETDAKTLLFQCIGEENPLPQSLLSACALGLLHNDIQLAELTVNELKKHDDDPSYGYHAVFLIAQFLLNQDKVREAIVYVSSKIHMHPNRAELRRVLVEILMQIRSNKSKYKTVTGRIALSSVELDMSATLTVTDSMVVSKSLALASKATQRISMQKAKVLAQRAVHVNPTCQEAWAAFVSVQS